MGKMFIASMATLTMLLACLPACSVGVNVTSLDITPPVVTVGDDINVTAWVKNTGSSQGVYKAILSVDGTAVENKEITVGRGATEAATFSVIKDKPGTYNIAVEKLNANITVNPRLVPKEMELKYDDGKGQVLYEASPWSSRIGYFIDFSAPSDPFTIKKLLIYGAIKLKQPPTG
ncbi:MAG: hypothetical protein FJ023_08455 [Chloroflexi bacterium]|nr:hypothetical protein [Chloroflexota bacterium]